MSDMLTKLGIDWKLLIAQFVNFMILFLVLRAAAWKPLLLALEERRAKIKQGIDDANKAEDKLTSIESERQEIISKARSEALRIIEEAKQKATMLKEELLQKANQEIEQQMIEAKEQIQSERQASYQALKNDMALFVSQATGKIIKNLDIKNQEKLIQEAINDLESA